MAEKKGNGFKTFLLILITVALAIFLGMAGFLILSPNSTIFGIQYRANIKTTTIQYSDTAQTQLLKFRNYSQINIDIAGGKGHTAVNINCGSPTDHMSASTITFKQASSGFQYAGASEKYSISVNESGNTLNIVVTEPNYNFVQVTNNSSINLNVFSATDNINNASINIKTGGGMVKIGGQIMTSPVNELTMSNLDVTTTSGKIQVSDKAKITNTATLTSKTGIIDISGNKSLSKLNIATETGKITTAEVVGDVSIKSYNSITTMGNITGNVDVDMTSGILNLKNINGNLISDHKILYTTVNVGKITGETTLINDQGNFSVNIKRTEGTTSIETGNKNVTIGEVAGTCSVITKNGTINVKKVSGNSNNLNLESKNNGSVFVTFEEVLGENIITTNSGRISMKFGENPNFNLDASSEKNKVSVPYRDVYEKSYIDPNPPDPSYQGSVTLRSNTGGIRVDIIK